MVDKHVITLIPVYRPTHTQHGGQLSQGRLAPEWHPLPHIAQAVFHHWGQLKVDVLVSSHINQCKLYHTLENPVPLVALGLNAFNYYWTFQVSSVFPPPAFVPLVLSKFLAEHVTGQFILPILLAACLIEAPWLPTVLSMLAEIPCQCSIIQDFIDISVG